MSYFDAGCEKHDISWQSKEIGDECPACKAEAELAALQTERDALKTALDNEIQNCFDLEMKLERAKGDYDELLEIHQKVTQ